MWFFSPYNDLQVSVKLTPQLREVHTHANLDFWLLLKNKQIKTQFDNAGLLSAVMGFTL